jgi:hypothetical protein
MIGNCRFDPDSGAPLSVEKHYPPGSAHYRTGARTPKYHPDSAWSLSREGALTNGEVRSSRRGLQGYFERVVRAVREGTEPDPRLDMAASNALRQLKSGGENGDGGDGAQSDRYTLDCFVWYALAERLCRKGWWVSWMLDYAIPRCPLCGSEAKFDDGVWHKRAICGSQSGPSNIPDELESQGYEPGHGDIDDALRREIRSTYNSAFAEGDEDAIETLELFAHPDTTTVDIPLRTIFDRLWNRIGHYRDLIDIDRDDLAAELDANPDLDFDIDEEYKRRSYAEYKRRLTRTHKPHK